MKDLAENCHQRAEWGLRRYVRQVATGLGVGLESACCDAATPATAYLALTQRLASAHERDVALCWDATHGWAIGMETGCGEDLITVSYLGGADLLSRARDVVMFTKTVLGGQAAGQPDPPIHAGDELTNRLAAYVRPRRWQRN